MDRTAKLKIYLPSGNPTALVEVKTIPNLADRKVINNDIMAKFPFVEQVGFIDDEFNLTMAGGERCINAIRCAALHYMKKLNLNNAKVLNLGDIFECGQDENGVFISSDFSLKFECKVQENGEFLVNLGGITHIVNFQELNLDDEELKIYALEKLKFYDLLNLEASGFINYNEPNLKPVVYVKDINTLFYESACGSGSIAVAVVLSLKSDNTKFKLIQPSGKQCYVNTKEREGCQNTGDNDLGNAFPDAGV